MSFLVFANLIESQSKQVVLVKIYETKILLLDGWEKC